MLKKILKFIFPILPFLALRCFVFRRCGYILGDSVYLPSSIKVSDIKTRRHNLVIGNRVSFGPNVLIITDSSPNNSILVKKYPLKSEIVNINDDAWIGANVIILPGVTIGKCTVIGAGSVILKDIPAYSVVAGNPARIIKLIDPDEL